MATPHALILRAPGTNCDHEVQTAFEMVGGRGTRLHINALRENPKQLRDYQILVLPGGFSYGDDIAAGKVQALYMQHFLNDALRQFRDDDREKLILGICNGFQAMLKAGLLVQPDEEGPLATLTNNDSGRYEDRWVYMQAAPGKCPFLKGMNRIHVPIGHGEGKFVCRKEWIVRGLDQAGQVVLRYVNEKDMEDVKEASVVLVYIGDDLGARMSPVLQKVLKPGTRIVSHRFSLGDWKPDKTEVVKGMDGDEYTLHYWVVKEKK